MNDREQVEQLKREASGQSPTQPPTQEAVEQFVMQQAFVTFLYYKTLMGYGFSHEDALYLAANAKL